MGSDVTLKQRIARWMEDHRGLIIVLVVLPLSLIFDALMKFRHWIYRKYISAPDKHDERVRAIQRKVQNWNKLPQAQRKMMCTARPNWQSLSTTFFRKDLCHKIPIALYDILELKASQMTLRVEPMVSVGDATAFLVPRGYTLAVCLEVAEATLGGLAMGVGMTTYSHKIGLYQEAVVAYEVVLADGSLVRATRDNEYSDLYYTLPWSHGTLGFLVALEVQIIKIKPHLKLEYIPVKGQKEYCNEMRKLSGALDKNQPTPDYLEATVYNKEDAVIMVGNFVDVPPEDQHKINHVTRWYKPWFYKHVESFLEKGRDYEYIPLKDYLLRHNRSIFWVVETMIPFGNHFLFRLLCGWLLPPKIAFLKFTTTPGVRAMTFTKQVFQDIVLPMNQLEDQIDKCEELFDLYPVLIYPCRVYDHGPHRGQLRPPRKEQMVPGTNYGMFNDLGVYGVPRVVQEKKRYDAVDKMRKMERFTAEVGGYPFLYADTFMTRKEFEQMFDLTAYEQVRQKYHANGAFPHLHDKIKPEIDVVEVFLVAVSCCAAQLALPYGQPWALPYAKLDISPEDETLVKPVALPTPYLHPYSYPLAGQALGALPYTYPLTYAVKPEPTLEATEFPLIFKAAESARRRRRDVVEVPLPYLHAVPTVKKATYETKTLETLEAATPADTTKLEIVTKEHEIDIPAVKYVRPVAKFQPIKQTVVSPAFLPYSYGPFSAYNPFLTIKPAEE